MQNAQEFLRTTSKLSDYTASFIIIASIVVAFLTFAIIIKVGTKRGNAQDSDSVTFAFSIVLIISVFAFLIVGTNNYSTTTSTMKSNLTENIKVVYNIDSIKYGELIEGGANDSIGDDKRDVTISKGDEVYRAFLVQNPDTYEPALKSYQNDRDISELKRTK